MVKKKNLKMPLTRKKNKKILILKYNHARRNISKLPSFLKKSIARGSSDTCFFSYIKSLSLIYIVYKRKIIVVSVCVTCFITNCLPAGLLFLPTKHTPLYDKIMKSLIIAFLEMINIKKFGAKLSINIIPFISFQFRH